MKAVGVAGPDFTPRLFDIDEPVAARGGVVVEVMAASVNDFDRAVVEGRYTRLPDQPEPVLLGRDFVGRVVAVGDGEDYIHRGMYVAGAVVLFSYVDGAGVSEVVARRVSFRKALSALGIGQQVSTVRR